MPIYAVTYTYDERGDLRAQSRPEHHDFLVGLHDDGVLLAAGAWADDGQPGGLLVVRAPDVAAVEAALDGDPYHREGLLVKREIRQWGQPISPWSE